MHVDVTLLTTTDLNFFVEVYGIFQDSDRFGEIFSFLSGALTLTCDIGTVGSTDCTICWCIITNITRINIHRLRLHFLRNWWKLRTWNSEVLCWPLFGLQTFWGFFKSYLPKSVYCQELLLSWLAAKNFQFPARVQWIGCDSYEIFYFRIRARLFFFSIFCSIFSAEISLLVFATWRFVFVFRYFVWLPLWMLFKLSGFPFDIRSRVIFSV